MLGPPRIERDGTLVAFDTRKAVAVVAYLALDRRSHPRDVLAELLWPDHDPEHARGALRRTLSTVRAGLGPTVLEATRDHVRLAEGNSLSVDVDRFRALCAAGDDAGAVALFRGGFLEGFGVRDAPEFDDWLVNEGDLLRRELAGALARLATDRAGAGDYLAALTHARRWLSLDPLHEPAHREVMRLYALIGDRAAALNQYRECVRTLSRELGVSPVGETTKLYETINTGSFEPPPVAAPAAVVPTKAIKDLPFVGRAEELRQLARVYADISRDGRVILVEGEAGIGKTRLAEELLAEPLRSGAAVVTGRGYEDEAALAYMPLVDALRAHLHSDDGWVAGVPPAALAEVARLLPELAEGRSRQSEADGPGAESRFLAGLWDTLVAAVSGPVPGVIHIDDAHWLDEASFRVLSYGLRRLAGRPLLILLTWRTPHDHPIRRLIGTMARGGAAAVRCLDRLDADAVGELLAAMRPAADPALSHRLHVETEGVPLLVVEYLNAMVSAAEPWPLPPGVRDLLRARFDRVTDTARQVLAAAAVIGRSFDADTVRVVSGRGEEETVSALEELLARGLVREGVVDYDFSHDQLRALVYDDTSLARRRLLHARAATAPGTPAGASARHLQLAGKDDAAAVAYVAAAEQAGAVFANGEAIEHLRAAIAVGHPDRGELYARIGDLYTRTGSYAEAINGYEAAAAEAVGVALADIEHRLGQVRHRRGEWVLAAAHFRAALDRAGDDGPADLRARILTDLSLTSYEAGHADRARELANRAYELADRAGEQRALGRAYNLLGMLASDTGDTDDALLRLRSGRELAEQIGDVTGQIAVLNNLALAHRARSELDLALELTHAALALCTAQGDRHREAALHNNLADLHHELGAADAAMRHLKRAVAIFTEVGDPAQSLPEVWKLVRW